MLMLVFGVVGFGSVAWFLPKLLRCRANLRRLAAALCGSVVAPALLAIWSRLEFRLEFWEATGFGRQTQMEYALVAAGLMMVLSGAVAAFEALWSGGSE